MIDQYNRWFPDYPGQMPYQDPQYVARVNQGSPQTAPAQPAAPQQTRQTFTPPMIHADIIQVGNVAEAEGYQMQPGASQMFITRDESQIVIREQHQGGYSLSVYDKRPPEPQKPPIDPSVYVTKDELEERLAQLVAQKAPRSALNKEAKE